MDGIKSALKGFWLVASVSIIITLLAIFAPDMLSQSRFVVGTPVSFPERIAYPATGITGFPPCNSRTNGKTYLFSGSLFTSVTCDGTTWDHWYGGVPVIPINPANFTSFNSGPETAALVDGGWQISAPALANDNLRIRDFPYPATPFTMVLGINSDIVAANFHSSGIVMRDSVGGRVEVFAQGHVNSPGFIVVTHTTVTAAGTVISNISTGGYAHPAYLFYADDGATRTFSFSNIGPLPSNTAASTHTALTQASGTFVVPDRLGLYINVNNGTCPITTTFFHCTVNGVPCI